ncbi:MAG: hypothetical protein GY862_02130 [Gammaproteobacteria bacterium]|nr:hypothetical protein [Gammaproteobacteria bacterium]
MKKLKLVFICFLFTINCVEKTNAEIIGPYLQNPSETGIVVSWISEGNRSPCKVFVESDKIHKIFIPSSFRMAHMKSWWINEAILQELKPDTEYRYYLQCNKNKHGYYAFTTKPAKNSALKILLLSDHQTKPMVRSTCKAIAHYLKKNKVNLILFAGDLPDYPDNPEEWFYNADKNGFFETLAGENKILQNITILPTVGNHEMGGYYNGSDPVKSFLSSTPANWNTVSYEEVFNLPQLADKYQQMRENRYKGKQITSGGEAFYAMRYGNSFIVSLFVARKWVPGNHEKKTGETYEKIKGYGRFIFEPVKRGSVQFNWLEEQLDSSQAKDAELKIVFFHHPVYTQGHSAIPFFGEPYQYKEDYIVRDLVPLFEKYKVNLVFYGHDHIVTHFYKNGVHYFESANIGNTYGAYKQTEAGLPAPEPRGLREKLFISDNENSYFSVLDTGNKKVSVYKVSDGEIIDKVYLFDLKSEFNNAKKPFSIRGLDR